MILLKIEFLIFFFWVILNSCFFLLGCVFRLIFEFKSASLCLIGVYLIWLVKMNGGGKIFAHELGFRFWHCC